MCSSRRTSSFEARSGTKYMDGRGGRSYRDKVRGAVPDFHNEIVELVTSPDRAAARLLYTGAAERVPA